MLLFMSYLAFPSGILRVAENYHQRRTELDERKSVQKLQRQYWLLSNTAYVVNRIEEIERQKEQAKQAQQQQEGAQS